MLDNSIQGFCFQLLDLSAWPGWASRVQGRSQISLCPQGLAQSWCPVSGQKSYLFAGLPPSPFKSSFGQPLSSGYQEPSLWSQACALRGQR